MALDPVNLAARAPKRLGGGCGGGCLITLAVLAVITVGVVIFVAVNFKSIATRIVVHVIEKSIDDSDLAPEEKARLIARIGRLRDDYLAGRITDEQMQRIGEEIHDSPLFFVGGVYVLDTRFVAGSGLSDDEKRAAKLTLQRVARGLHEKKIDNKSLEPAWRIVTTGEPKGKRDLKEKITDGELRDFLKLAKEQADKAKIPDEPMQIDLADELDKAIERALEDKPF
jgi:hypothetical protein